MISRYSLSAEDIDLIGAALHAAANGPFFPDWEFQTLIGVTRSQLKEIGALWPQNEADPLAERAIRSTLANLCGYPHNQPVVLESMTTARSERLLELLDKLDD